MRLARMDGHSRSFNHDWILFVDLERMRRKQREKMGGKKEKWGSETSPRMTNLRVHSIRTVIFPTPPPLWHPRWRPVKGHMCA